MMEMADAKLFKMPTTMPMSAFVLVSTVPSSTRFMNWSNPRSTPMTPLLPFSWTAGAQASRASVSHHDATTAVHSQV
jgi:hypothetical protein